MPTCNQLDLQTLGSQPVMPRNLPNHCNILKHFTQILFSQGYHLTWSRRSLGYLIPPKLCPLSVDQTQSCLEKRLKSNTCVC